MIILTAMAILIVGTLIMKSWVDWMTGATSPTRAVKCPCGRPGKSRICPRTKEACTCCTDCWQAFCEWS